jgi:hypothetical protein
MDYKNSFKRRKSLGVLREAQKTKPRSPDVQGTMKAQRHTIETLLKQLDEAETDEIIANLAGWFYQDANGPYLTVELSPRYISRKERQRREEPINTFDAFFQEKENIH